MKYPKLILLLFLVLSLTFISCSDDDDDSNPAAPPEPASAGEYSGTNSYGEPMSVTISGINGVAFITAYSISYSIVSGGSTLSGTNSSSVSTGITQVNNNTFTISLGSESDETLTGTISGGNMTGTFNFPVTPTVSATGTYTITKN